MQLSVTPSASRLLTLSQRPLASEEGEYGASATAAGARGGRGNELCCGQCSSGRGQKKAWRENVAIRETSEQDGRCRQTTPCPAGDTYRLEEKRTEMN